MVLLMFMILMLLKIYCCIPHTSLWLTAAQHKTSRTHNEGEAKASGGRKTVPVYQPAGGPAVVCH